MPSSNVGLKKWEPPTSRKKTPTHLNNHHTQQAIQRPIASSDHRYFSRLEQNTVTHKQTRSPRINPDSIKTLWFTVGLIVILGLTSFLVSFNGLLDVAAWVGLPLALRWTVPAFIDVSILAYSMAAVIHKARGEAVFATWASLAVFTLISVIANAVHAISKGEGNTLAQVIIGATIAAAAPIAVFAATEELSRLAFRAPATRFSAVKDESITVETEPNIVAGAQHPQLTSTATPEPTEPEETTETLEAPCLAAVPDEPVEETEEKSLDDDMEALAQWVQVQSAQGVKVTGAMVAEAIGKSPRTGNNRLSQLKENRPELFDDEV